MAAGSAFRAFCRVVDCVLALALVGALTVLAGVAGAVVWLARFVHHLTA